MNNIRFLEQILTTAHEYWIVSKQDTWASGKTENSVWFISIPYKIHRGLNRNDIKLTDLEDLQRCEVPNISLTESYPPFQYGISFYNLLTGFPLVSGSPKEFLIRALAITSSDIYIYKRELKEFFELPEQVVETIK